MSIFTGSTAATQSGHEYHPNPPAVATKSIFRLWQTGFNPQTCLAGDRFIMVFVKIIEIQLDLLGPEL